MIKRIIRNGFLTLLAALLLSSQTRTAATSAQAAPKYKEMHYGTEINTKTDVKISWKKQKEAAGYWVYRSAQLKRVKYKTSYYYKVRASKIIKDKKIYGKYSAPVLLSAVNADGIFQAEILTPKTEKGTSLDILLTSKKENADAAFDEIHVWDASLLSKSNGSRQLKCLYSLNGKEWKNFSEKAIVIKPNEKIDLRLESKDGKAFLHPAYEKETCELWPYDLSYNRLTCYLTIDFTTNIGTVCSTENITINPAAGKVTYSPSPIIKYQPDCISPP